MGNEIILRDQNFVTVLAGITDDSNQYIRMLRVDPATGRVLISATGGGGTGTVTSVSVVTANGFAGDVATPTTTPAITIKTTLTAGQIPVSNGTGFQSAPLTGTGNIVLDTSPTFSGATITTSTVNGVTLVSGGSSAKYLSEDGTYTTPAGGGTVTSVSGTANRITSTGGNTPVIDISASYVGQASITTLGTITTGVWNGTVVAGQYGGTGVANTGKTITIGGNFTTSGAFTTTLVVSGNTSVTLPTTGTLVNTAVTTLSSLVSIGTITTGGLGTGAVIGGVTMTLGSDASFDMYYRNGSGVLTRLANGTTGQVLNANTGAAPTWGSGGSSQWVTTGSDIYYTTGKVWIGRNSGGADGAKLYVYGATGDQRFEIETGDNSTVSAMLKNNQGQWDMNIVSSGNFTIDDFITSNLFVITKTGAKVILSGSADIWGSRLSIQSNTTSASNAELVVAGGTGVNGDAGFIITSLRGTVASPTATQSNDRIGAFYFAGYDGTSFNSLNGSVEFRATQNWTTGAKGTRASIQTTQDGTTARREVLAGGQAGDIQMTIAGFWAFHVEATGSVAGNVITADFNVSAFVGSGVPVIIGGHTQLNSTNFHTGASIGQTSGGTPTGNTSRMISNGEALIYGKTQGNTPTGITCTMTTATNLRVTMTYGSSPGTGQTCYLNLLVANGF